MRLNHYMSSSNYIHWALLADVHVDVSLQTAPRGHDIAENLETCIEEIVESKPNATIIAGDLAFAIGLKCSYKNLAMLLKPLSKKGNSIYMILGNHDNRNNFLETFPEFGFESVLKDKLCSLLEKDTFRAIFLDSLDENDGASGILGHLQLNWLAKELADTNKKPVLIFLHHYPYPDSEGKGLLDFDKLMEIILPAKHVKAVIFGHAHRWELKKINGLHLINLPSSAYRFVNQPENHWLGWVSALIWNEGMKLRLNCIENHQQLNAKEYDLHWR